LHVADYRQRSSLCVSCGPAVRFLCGRQVRPAHARDHHHHHRTPARRRVIEASSNRRRASAVIEPTTRVTTRSSKQPRGCGWNVSHVTPVRHAAQGIRHDRYRIV